LRKLASAQLSEQPRNLGMIAQARNKIVKVPIASMRNLASLHNLREVAGILIENTLLQAW